MTPKIDSSPGTLFRCSLALVLFFITALATSPASLAEEAESSGKKSSHVWYGQKSDLIYRVQPNGDRIIDFGGAGYQGQGEKAVPAAADLRHLPSMQLKQSQNVQSAIDKMAGWPLRPDGFRGVIYLSGRHKAGFTLNASGIVLVGRKSNPNASGETILNFKGNDQKAIKIDGREGGQTTKGKPVKITSLRVPTGSRSFLVEDPSEFSVGDRVEIILKPNVTWVKDIGMDKEFWKPNDLVKKMSRVVTSINGNEINIDEPTVITIWDRHGGATINTVEGGGPITNVGIMGVSIEGNKIRGPSTLPGVAIYTGFSKDVFLRSIRTSGFQRSALYVSGRTENLTAYSVHYQGAGPTGGSHRYGFQIGGQKNFLYKPTSYSARHAFVPNPGSTGGNVFQLAISTKCIFESGGHRHWSGATLWDQVHIKHDKLTARKVRLPNINHGWRAVNNVSWNSRGRQGHKGVVFQNPKFAYNIKESNIDQIKSLYKAQRDDRAGGIQFREYVIGDYDSGKKVNRVDRHTADPDWSASLGGGIALDTPLKNRTVAMTFHLNLLPGERVVGGQLSIGRKGNRGNMTIDLNGIYKPVGSGQVTTIDMANKLNAIQNGKLNVAVTSNYANAGVDFAMLKLKLVWEPEGSEAEAEAEPGSEETDGGTAETGGDGETTGEEAGGSDVVGEATGGGESGGGGSAGDVGSGEEGRGGGSEGESSGGGGDPVAGGEAGEEGSSETGKPDGGETASPSGNPVPAGLSSDDIVELTIDSEEEPELMPADTWSSYYSYASYLYNYYTSTGYESIAAAYYYYYQGLGDSNYYNAIGMGSEADFSYYNSLSLFHYNNFLQWGDLESSIFYYHYYQASAYYYYYLGYGDSNNANYFYNAFIGAAFDP